MNTIRDLVQRLSARPNASSDPNALQAEIDRLRSQNESMKRAMRHCIDCEYRVEVIASRANTGRAADGGEPDHAG